MGNSTSKATLSSPFPVNSKLQNNLDLMTEIVSHIMNTADIYDLNNLLRPGVCGDYAVMLKKDIEKKFLPFTVDISGKLTRVVYQNPKKMIRDEAVRKKICSEIATSAIRISAIVLACLSSIQVASDSREAQVFKQRGGTRASDITESVQWLRRNEYLVTRGTETNYQVDHPISRIKYVINFIIESESIKVKVQIKSELDPSRFKTIRNLEERSLELLFLKPIMNFVPTESQYTIIPISLLDSTGISWLAGVLITGRGQPAYIPFKKVNSASQDALGLYDLLVELITPEYYNKIGDELTDIEREESQQIFDEAVKKLERSESEYKTYFLNDVMRKWIKDTTGYDPVYNNMYPGNPLAGLLGGRGGIDQIIPAPVEPRRYEYGRERYGHRNDELTNQYDVQYVIPSQASKDIKQTLSTFKDLIVKKSCPAAVRANTLSISFDESTHTTRTGVCNDPYWKEPDLSKIYPYATLQFLSMEDFKEYSISTQKRVRSEWTQFLSDLSGVYSGPVTIRGAGSTSRLENLSFKVSGLPVCTTKSPFVKFEAVQNALNEIYTEYNNHVIKIWNIINKLVVVFTDPETRENIIRLNPNVTNVESMMYINGVAKMAIEQLTQHYLNIERIYYGAAQLLERTEV